MRPSRVLFTIGAAAIVSLGLVSLSDIEPATGHPGVPAVPHVSEPIVAPVTGKNLFQPAQPGPAGSKANDGCLSEDDIVAVFAGDAQQVGGEIVIMTDGFQQNFSDYWRRMAGVDRVRVSAVLAHVVHGIDTGPIVDVVEFDQAGCALSRTLMSHEDWMELLRLSNGVEV